MCAGGGEEEDVGASFDEVVEGYAVLVVGEETGVEEGMIVFCVSVRVLCVGNGKVGELCKREDIRIFQILSECSRGICIVPNNHNASCFACSIIISTGFRARANVVILFCFLRST